ncbi:hypothetical protein BGX38DRAFT_699353 [Terfezia claveryi]|nr:hypothetical protein BGX38DRAFT_699353 [Terfezia claveryi]
MSFSNNMTSTTHTAPGQNEFARGYVAIVICFEQICALDGHRHGIHMDVLSAISDQRGKFRVWAENVGVHLTGKASLHHRLREAPHIRSYLYELLRNLQELLTEAPERIGKYSKFQVSQFTHEESQRLKNKYPHLANDQRVALLGRLVQANLRRRQIFLYALSHHNKIATPEIPGNEI